MMRKKNTVNVSQRGENDIFKKKFFHPAAAYVLMLV
jgi:hypothetical protein